MKIPPIYPEIEENALARIVEEFFKNSHIRIRMPRTSKI